jgi:hypothetical protein
MEEFRESKRLKRRTKRKAKKQQKALKMSDKQLLRSARRSYRRNADQITELPPRRSFKSKIPKGEKCLAWMPYKRGYGVRQCMNMAVIPCYCEEHQSKRKQL